MLATPTPRLMIDDVIHYRMGRGGMSPTVFKLATRALPPGGTARLRGARSFALRTTRRLHPGPHALELQVNGRRVDKTAFDLIGPGRT